MELLHCQKCGFAYDLVPGRDKNLCPRCKPKPQDFHSTEDIIRCHRGHYFDKGTMRFFRSRILSYAFPGKTEVYFVTSEQFVGSTCTKPRRFTVRAYNPETDNIRTVQPFNELTRSKALRIARDLAETV